MAKGGDQERTFFLSDLESFYVHARAESKDNRLVILKIGWSLQRKRL